MILKDQWMIFKYQSWINKMMKYQWINDDDDDLENHTKSLSFNHHFCKLKKNVISVYDRVNQLLYVENYN